MNPLSATEALHICLQSAPQGQTCLLPLEQALGQVISQDMYSTEDLPPFRRALMDGFAIRAADVQTASAQDFVELQVTGELAAGHWTDVVLQPNAVVRTMTGAPVITGADAVVRLEQVETRGKGQGRQGQSIFITAPVPVGESIQERGGDLPAGSLLFPAGTRVSSREVALLAASGIQEMHVVKSPEVGILITGNELATEREHLKAGQIRNSNGPMLNALLNERGFPTVVKSCCTDEIEAVRTAVLELLPEVDVLVTTGGVSVGDYDVVPAVMEEMGFRIVVRHVRMRPGKPFTLGIKQGVSWFAVPGNPAAAFLTAQLFVLPTLRKMGGEREALRKTPAVLIDRPGKKVAPVDQYWFAHAQLAQGQLRVSANQLQSSCSVSTLRGVNAFVEVPAGSDPQPGDFVQVILTSEVAI